MRRKLIPAGLSGALSRAARPYRVLASGLARRYRDADLGINAAAVAYNAFLALVPLGLALLGVAAIIGGSQAALDRVESTLATRGSEES